MSVEAYTYSDERYVGVARFVFLISIWSHGAIALGTLALGEWLLVLYFAGVTVMYAGLSRLRSLPELIRGTWLAFAEVASVTWLLVARYEGGLGVLSLLLFLIAGLFFVPVSTRMKLGVAAALNAFGALLIGWYGLIDGGPLRQLTEAVGLLVTMGFLAGLSHYYNLVVTQAEARLRAEHAKSERLLHNAMPAVIASRLKDEPSVIADKVPAATVLFADIVGFTPLAASLSPEELLVLLDDLFRRFDRCTDAAGMEKIKTIGDAYMAAAGVPEPASDHAARACSLGLAMLEAVESFNADRGVGLGLRVGLHSGPLVAGVIGERRFAYDLWGDTVNVAARMESHGLPGRVAVSEAVVAAAQDFAFESRGLLEIKGKGPMEVLFLIGPSE